VTNLLLWLIVGGVAGFLASKVLSGKGMGLLMDIVVGLVGAFIGGYLAGLAGLSTGGLLEEIIVAFVGAFLLLVVARLVFARRRFGAR
jgi:uncharacterized membrane protein YeaQ/YmgE (transglycosylase-associated protein family)